MNTVFIFEMYNDLLNIKMKIFFERKKNELLVDEQVFDHDQLCWQNKQGRREELKAGGGYFWKWEKGLKKRFEVYRGLEHYNFSKLGESLKGIFSQNRSKFEKYFLQKLESIWKIFSPKIGVNLRNIFSQNRRKFEKYSPKQEGGTLPQPPPVAPPLVPVK